MQRQKTSRWKSCRLHQATDRLVITKTVVWSSTLHTRISGMTLLASGLSSRTSRIMQMQNQASVIRNLTEQLLIHLWRQQIHHFKPDLQQQKSHVHRQSLQRLPQWQQRIYLLIQDLDWQKQTDQHRLLQNRLQCRHKTLF